MILQLQSRDDAGDAPARDSGEVLDEVTGGSFWRFSKSPAWQPAVNIYEDAESLHLCVELAGLTRDEITVEVEGRRLTIRGERPVPAMPPGTGPSCVLRMEISSGVFHRRVELPEHADTERISARLKHGYLWIRIPKTEA